MAIPQQGRTFSTEPAAHGLDESVIVMVELYKLAVEMADRVSARRSVANAFFLSIQTAFLGAIGITLASVRSEPGWLAPVITLAGFAISAAWWLQLRSYRDLNAAKFQVINQVETQLPIRIFSDEWALLKPTPAASGPAAEAAEPPYLKGHHYTELGASERTIPWIFAALHALLLLGRMLG
ncbi:RipA family octameric membrane protein [Streptacidiphilus neutrinimicus]|uniref:RipA family octameric membrane protein n=1 Tax=Streptacidiphilus neutrinimicus TaxID=105420 RepID=UPI000A072E31|nr:hypothetical protein [Streptacidiphilus neutrinimicus]